MNVRNVEVMETLQATINEKDDRTLLLKRMKTYLNQFRLLSK